MAVLYPKQFSVYWCNLQPAFGAQMQKTRPCVVVSPDAMNKHLKTVIIVPFTSTIRRFPFYIPVLYSGKPGALACDQIKTIDKSRVGEHYADLKPDDIGALSTVLQDMFSV